MPDDFDDYEQWEDEGPSKSALKRQMTALQELGVALTRLSDRQLARVPVEDERLRRAILETRRITSNSARRRHMQFIGKLMRDIDPAPIEAALQDLHAAGQADNERFHELERLRDLVLTEGDSGIQRVMDRWPGADRQQLRQLLRQHQQETAKGKAPAASRKLFKLLRECQDNYGKGDGAA